MEGCYSFNLGGGLVNFLAVESAVIITFYFFYFLQYNFEMCIRATQGFGALLIMATSIKGPKTLYLHSCYPTCFIVPCL